MIEAHDNFVRPYKMQLVYIQNIQLNSTYERCVQMGRTELWCKREYIFKHRLNSLLSDGMDSFL
jgi:hypothetical protein